MQKALQAWEAFRHPDATLALDGGTCLVLYHGLQQRFSEDLDIRVILNEELERGPGQRRIEAFRSVSAAFARHVHHAPPFLETTRKGRFRKRDGRFESHIFRYRGRRPHREVMEGLKLELVQEPARLPLQEREAERGGRAPDWGIRDRHGQVAGAVAVAGRKAVHRGRLRSPPGRLGRHERGSRIRARCRTRGPSSAGRRAEWSGHHGGPAGYLLPTRGL